MKLHELLLNEDKIARQIEKEYAHPTGYAMLVSCYELARTEITDANMQGTRAAFRNLELPYQFYIIRYWQKHIEGNLRYPFALEWIVDFGIKHI